MKNQLWELIELLDNNKVTEYFNQEKLKNRRLTLMKLTTFIALLFVGLNGYIVSTMLYPKWSVLLLILEIGCSIPLIGYLSSKLAMKLLMRKIKWQLPTQHKNNELIKEGSNENTLPMVFYMFFHKVNKGTVLILTECNIFFIKEEGLVKNLLHSSVSTEDRVEQAILDVVMSNMTFIKDHKSAKLSFHSEWGTVSILDSTNLELLNSISQVEKSLSVDERVCADTTTNHLKETDNSELNMQLSQLTNISEMDVAVLNEMIDMYQVEDNESKKQKIYSDLQYVLKMLLQTQEPLNTETQVKYFETKYKTQ